MTDKYDYKMEIDDDFLKTDNNSHSLILKQIKPGTTVLECGPANGIMTKYMKKHLGCKVYIIEYDREAFDKAIKYADFGICADLERDDWISEFQEGMFDYILFADVLEHLRKPEKVLEKIRRFLKEDGNVLMSIPNVAHGDIIINMLQGRFRYTPLGLLDDTHFHLFAREDIHRMIDEAGYYLIDETCTVLRPFTTEQAAFLESGKQTKLSNYIYSIPETRVYQYICRLSLVPSEEHSDVISRCIADDSYCGKVFLDMGEGYSDSFFVVPEFSAIDEKIVLKAEIPSGCVHARYVSPNIPAAFRNIKVLFNEKPLAVSSNTNHISNTDILCSKCPELEFVVNGEPGIAEISAEVVYLISKTNNELTAFIDDINRLKTELSNEKEKNRVLSEKTTEQIQSLSKELQKVNAEYRSAAAQRDSISYQFGILQNSYNAVIDSHCWKLTRPVRWLGDGLKNTCQRSKLLSLTWKGVKSLRDNGFSYTRIKVMVKFFPSRVSNYSSIDTAARGIQLAIDDIGELDNADNMTIAVHVHLFYEDLLEELCGYLDNIPFSFDVFVSVRDGIDLEQTGSRLSKIKNVNNVCVETTVNRGRDIAPLYLQFGERIKKYDCFLHMHSKKSLFTGTEQKEWRRYSLDTLLGSEERIRKIFTLLCDQKIKAGLVYPETRNLHLIAHSWLSNRLEGKNLLERMGMPFEDGFYNYPVGSFFWAKNDAVHNLFDIKLHLEDFPVETGQTDGTTAHALERVVAFVNKNNGYHSAIIDDEDGIVRFDESLKIFRDYFALQYESVQYHLALFDLVSFDIFDTLISRSVCRPDDLFRLMEKRINREIGINCDFPSARKAAEEKANNRKGKYTNIYDIYEAIPEVCSALGKYAETIMQWELEMELDLCFPREDMLKVYNFVHASGKRILLISDMYLPKAVLEKMLLKCGYGGYEDIWVSCERGERKDDGSMWESFYGTYGAIKSIHCGDNAHSDIQLPGNYRKETFFVLNPFEGIGLSDLNPLIKKWSKKSNSVSMIVSLGLIINRKIFNSPFVLEENGRLMIDDPFEFGYCAFGPLLAYFTEWVLSKCKVKKLLLLSREGYILNRFFDTYSEACGNTDINAVYFLASRRAASLGAVRSAEDVREILMIYYEGKLSNLTRERLGFDLTDKTKDNDIVLPRDIDEVMELLSPYMPEILKRASIERSAYIKYISESVDDINDAAIVDVGYSGTIQYFLSKMLKTNIDGLYLSTRVEKKPEILGCNCISAFPVMDTSEEHTNLIFKNQLFLEALLKAPFGQLICFEDSGGKIQPTYKQDNEIPDDLALLQKGAVSFAEEYWGIISKYAPEERLDGKFASELFDFMLNSPVMGQRIADCLNVNDEYCSGGKWNYSFKEKRFIVHEKSGSSKH